MRPDPATERVDELGDLVVRDDESPGDGTLRWNRRRSRRPAGRASPRSEASVESSAAVRARRTGWGPWRSLSRVQRGSLSIGAGRRDDGGSWLRQPPHRNLRGRSRSAWGLDSGSAARAMTGTTTSAALAPSVVSGLQRAVPQRVVHGQHGAVVRGRRGDRRPRLRRPRPRRQPAGTVRSLHRGRTAACRPGARRCARGRPS